MPVILETSDSQVKFTHKYLLHVFKREESDYETDGSSDEIGSESQSDIETVIRLAT